MSISVDFEVVTLRRQILEGLAVKDFSEDSGFESSTTRSTDYGRERPRARGMSNLTGDPPL